jgi:hypothetical protein
MERDVNIPIDGPTGHRLFRMSERTGLPFQIHYEVEDELLAPLEQMLGQYPKAKVIWWHTGPHGHYYSEKNSHEMANPLFHGTRRKAVRPVERQRYACIPGTVYLISVF